MASSNNRVIIPSRVQDITADDAAINANEGVATFTPGENTPKLRRINAIIAKAVAMALAAGAGDMPAGSTIAFGNAAPVFDTNEANIYLQVSNNTAKLWIRGAQEYTATRWLIDITNYAEDINRYADARVVELVPEWARASAPPATTGLSATLHELDRAVSPTHIAGDTIRKAGFYKTIQADLSERVNRAGTLYGDTTDIDYGQTNAGTITGWGKGADNYRFTICGVRIAEVPANGRPILEGLRGDLAERTAIKILEYANGYLYFVNPAKQTERIAFTANANFISLGVGDHVIFEPYDTGQSLRVVAWVVRANGSFLRCGTFLFEHDPADGVDNPAGKFSLEGLHLQHSVGGPGNDRRASIDRVFLSKHSGIVEWNLLQNIFGEDLALDPPASIAGGTRKQGAGHERLTFTEEVDFTGGIKENGADLAREPAVIEAPTLESGTLTFDIPEGKTLGDYDSIQLRFTFTSPDTGITAAARTQSIIIPVQTLIGGTAASGVNTPLGMRGAAFYYVNVKGYASHDGQNEDINANTGGLQMDIADANNNTHTATANFESVQRLVLMPL